MGAERISPLSSPSRRTALLWVGGWLALFGVMSYSAALQKCATCDEPLHAAAGAVIRQAGDYRIDPEDPALFTFLAALPHRADAIKIDTSTAAFAAIPADHTQQVNVAIDILYRSPDNDGAQYINQSRLLFTLIGIALGALIAWWAHRIAGPAAAMIAIVLYALDPNFLAHASLVKNDVLISLLMLWLAGLVWLLGQRISVLRIAALTVCCCCAINIKFSGLILEPMALAILLIRALLPDPWKIGSRQLQSRRGRLAFLLGLAAVLTVASWAATWAIYAPDRAPPADWIPLIRDAKLRQLDISGAHDQIISATALDQIPDRPPVKVIWFLGRHHLMPHAWLTGLLYTYDSTISRSTYLLGKRSVAGWWYYFPLAMLFKTPLMTLLLAAALAVGGSCRLARRRGPMRIDWTLLCLWAPIVIYGIPALRTHLNLGLRHILPIYPFIYLIMSGSLAGWLRGGGRLTRPILAAALLALGAESFSAWPDYIPFFNVACRGSRGGLALLGDSNLDWGQDLPLVSEWQQNHPGTLLYFSYFGSVDPAYYGISYVNVVGGYPLTNQPQVLPRRAGVFAISATNLQEIYYTDRELAQMKDVIDFLHQQQPLRVLGGSIYLYDWRPENFDAFVARHR